MIGVREGMGVDKHSRVFKDTIYDSVRPNEYHISG